MLNEMTLLLAQTEPSTMQSILLWLLIGGCMIVPWVLGWYISRQVKMPDYGIHIGLLLWLLAISTLRIGTGWPPKLGIDLKGGVILEYEVYPSEDGSQISMDSVVSRVEERLNSSGLKEISIRAVGNSRIEVIVPDVEPTTVMAIKEMIHKAGLLEFRIVAHPEKHRDVISLAEAQAISDPLKTSVIDGNGEEVGKWVGIGREDTGSGRGDYKIKDFYRHTIRNADTGAVIRFAEIPAETQADILRATRPTSKARVDKIFEKLGHPKVEILMATNDGEDVKGEDLSSTKTGIDENGNPEVLFRIKSASASRFASLTSKFKRDASTNEPYLLGIVLDDELLSAPTIENTISDSGRIMGKFTQAEVKSLVEILEAGTMPAKMNKDPLRESQTSPLLGEDMIRKSGWAMGIASLLVLIFMVAYYRFAGLIACLAVVANIFFTVALMIGISAALTLTGIAGMVLTIGMAVDANVLIYERMREETAKGASLRMAIRNGFDRAFTTILDSNLTTILTAVILYLIGTAQVKGFAVTLVLGIATSMFTACYASRIVFDIAERTKLYRKINFAEWIGVPKIDYVKIMVPMSIISAVLIVIGMGAFFARGKGVFDIDFNGGTSVIATLKEKMEMNDVRQKLNENFEGEEENGTKATFTLTGIRGVQNVEDGRIWKIDSSLLNEKRLQDIVKKTFSTEGGTQLVVHNLVKEAFTQEEVALPPVAEEETPSSEGNAETPAPPSTPATNPETPAANPETPAEKPAEKPADPPAEGSAAPAETPSEKPAGEPTEKPGDPPSDPPAAAEEQSSFSRKLGAMVASQASPRVLLSGLLQEGEAKPAAQEGQKPAESPAESNEAKPVEGQESAEPKATQEPAPSTTEPEVPPAEPAPTQESTQPTTSKPKLSRFLTKAKLEFDQPIDGYVLKEKINTIALAKNLEIGEVSTRALDSQSNSATTWEVSMRCEQSAAEQIISTLKADLPKEPVWASSDKITGQVAADAQKYALIALFVSLLGIVAYVWFRFEQISFGFAAVAALVHDVLITLAALGTSAYLAPYFGFLMVDEFKISLPVVAAILTLVGYSLNDTIVTFDRIREVRGKSPNLTPEMINLSVNQTMSRTILTFLTVFIVVVILYFFGGESIHGFAFCMMIGSVAGVYSSIFIAAPLLLLLKPKPQATGK
jgi:SecD/SecF fusion protein